MASPHKLTAYRRKRNFARTPEPRPTTKGSPHEAIFVVQKHRATHLHYDFRLQMEGVLKSWAVPKEPPLLSGQKRLAIETEDHPLEYASFSGVIPPGNYGAGTVEIWDHGTFLNLKEKPLFTCYQEGHIEIMLVGKKLKGPYALVKTKLGTGDKKEWLLLKMKK